MLREGRPSATHVSPHTAPAWRCAATGSPNRSRRNASSSSSSAKVPFQPLLRCSTMPRNESGGLGEGSGGVQRRTTKVCTTRSAAKSLDLTLLPVRSMLVVGGFVDLHAEIVAPVVSAAFKAALEAGALQDARPRSSPEGRPAPGGGSAPRMTARDLVGRDPQTVRYQAAKEFGREEAILRAQHEPRRNLGPRCQRPRRSHGGLGWVRALSA